MVWKAVVKQLLKNKSDWTIVDYELQVLRQIQPWPMILTSLLAAVQKTGLPYTMPWSGDVHEKWLRLRYIHLYSICIDILWRYSCSRKNWVQNQILQHRWPDNKPKKTWSQKKQEIRSFQNSQAFPENSKLLKIYTLKWWLKDYVLLYFPFEIVSFHGLLGRGLPPAASTPSPHASCGLHASLWHDRCSSPVLPEAKKW